MSFSFLKGRANPVLVVCESDIDAALAHLRRLPHRKNLLMSWDRQRLIDLVRDTVGRRPRMGQCVDIAPGVFGVIKPLGYDRTMDHRSSDVQERLQIVLAVRRGAAASTAALIAL